MSFQGASTTSSKTDGGMPSESGILVGFSRGPIWSMGWLCPLRQIGVVPAVVVAFEFQEFGAAGVGAGQAKR